MKITSLILLPVKTMLRQYIKYDVLACIFWLSMAVAVGIVLSLAIDSLSRTISEYNYVVGILLWPIYLPFTLVIWAGGLLINEFIWMLFGVYSAFRIRPHFIRNILFRLAGISLKVGKDV